MKLEVLLSVMNLDIKDLDKMNITSKCTVINQCGKKGTEYLRTIFGSRVIRFQYLKGIKDVGETNKEQFDKMYQKTIKILKEKTNGKLT